MLLRELKKVLSEYDKTLFIYLEDGTEHQYVESSETKWDGFEVISIESGQCGGDPLCVTLGKEVSYEQTHQKETANRATVEIFGR